MSMYNYESVHDLNDIMNMIYADCGDYAVKCWNYVDAERMKLAFTGIAKAEDGTMEAKFKAYPENAEITAFCPATVEDWQLFLKKAKLDGREWDAAKVAVSHWKSGKAMNFHFSGSSNPDKEVSYTLSYEDPEWHRGRFALRMRMLWLKWKADSMAKRLFGGSSK